MTVLAAILFLLLLASFGGAIHPAGDSLAVFRPVLAVALVLCALWLHGAVLAGAAAVVMALVLVPAILPRLNTAPVPDAPGVIALYQKNLRYDLADPGAIIADIRDSGADIVTLVEVSDSNMAVPDGLRDAYPHQSICPAHSVGAVAILSRWPLTDANFCRPGTGFSAVGVQTPGGAVTAAVLHLHWPWPYGQPQQVAGMLADLRALPQPVILAGDLNMVPRSHTVRRIARATSTTPVGPPRTTFLLKGLYPMAIDHIFAPDGWAAQLQPRPHLGSDHRGLIARIARP